MTWTWDRFVGGEDPRIFHFTHIDNLAAVLEHGALVADCSMRAAGTRCSETGNPEIKQRRRFRSVSVQPGGVVGDYVPFYFAPRSPMLFKVARKNFAQGRRVQNELIYLVSRVSAVEAVRPVVCSDRNAAASLVEFKSGTAGLGHLVDWDLMRSAMWNDTDDDPDRRQRRMAELLVHESVPIGCLTGIGVRGTEVAERAIRCLAGTALARLEVAVLTDWYFDERGWQP
ncbi:MULTISPECIES: DUF4433 domain-containing protein [unclassified Crossiella]|uniref:type II toxin-antitoxin system toxin DNA ADP-ribosyl transferase DarT n=1 Tax=unclassified Crossiella TaxID=2620835 RepID=UPI001FFEC3B0|nr:MULTISPECIES: DUF4433 domain-containing protein [unclassified Crossiella]MCK2236250.1 DUF4433 domain-containing protein [Crossiella sp. S99.2]MCK2249917.1 DUF4433 domain-containing protein [Crossiella sp. S99.1]